MFVIEIWELEWHVTWNVVILNIIFFCGVNVCMILFDIFTLSYMSFIPNRFHDYSFLSTQLLSDD
jgi:hypothetical protein